MNSIEDAKYRLRVAKGFLAEARQDFELGRWRSCVDGAQLACENALKAVIALWSPVPRTHDPARVWAQQAFRLGREVGAHRTRWR